MRIGFGFDAHRFAVGRKLVLGGVEIAHEQGLLGHSDADALTHAIMDALLGACGLLDIGQMFPDTDPMYQDARSLDLLAQVLKRVKEAKYRLINLDATVICEAPRIALYCEAMKATLARTLGIETGCISIKGKTTEKMGFTGRGEGIAAYAVVLLQSEKDWNR